MGRGAIIAAMVAMAATTGCTREVLNQGYVQSEDAISLVGAGSSREQVLLALGTPSTTATFGNEVFYYISQKRVRTFAFQNPRIADQRVLAVYFTADDTVERVANYTLKDGQVFDTISRTTPTAGKDESFLQQVIVGGLGKRK